MKTMRLVIIGAGGYGRSVADIAQQTRFYQDIVLLDDADREGVAGPCSSFLDYKNNHTEYYPAFGDNAMRMNWAVRLSNEGCLLATIIHPLAYVSPTAKLDESIVVMPHASIGTNCIVHGACIINMGAIVDHDCILEEAVHIAPGAVVKAGNRIPIATKIDSGTVVQNEEYPING